MVYGMGISAELADDEPSDCRPVVGFVQGAVQPLTSENL